MAEVSRRRLRPSRSVDEARYVRDNFHGAIKADLVAEAAWRTWALLLDEQLGAVLAEFAVKRAGGKSDG
jgi:hypothetical protein